MECREHGGDGLPGHLSVGASTARLVAADVTPLECVERHAASGCIGGNQLCQELVHCNPPLGRRISCPRQSRLLEETERSSITSARASERSHASRWRVRIARVDRGGRVNANASRAGDEQDRLPVVGRPEAHAALRNALERLYRAGRRSGKSVITPSTPRAITCAIAAGVSTVHGNTRRPSPCASLICAAVSAA